MVCGLWFVVCGLWFVVCGLWLIYENIFSFALFAVFLDTFA
jgi:hypothetical protein